MKLQNPKGSLRDMKISVIDILKTEGYNIEFLNSFIDERVLFVA